MRRTTRSGSKLGTDHHLGGQLMHDTKALLDEAGSDAHAIVTRDDDVAAGKQFRETFPDKAGTAVGSRSISLPMPSLNSAENAEASSSCPTS